jgi:uncharacterized protein (DUF983 family)
MNEERDDPTAADRTTAASSVSGRRWPRPEVGTLIARALRLRCPRCGEGRLFLNWFTMPERCSGCRLKFERAPGYFLGSSYINYGLTAVMLLVAYIVLHYFVGLTNRQLAAPLTAFCMAFPLFAFRYARALWLAQDCRWDPEMMSSAED